MQCSNCGHANKADANFCEQCGTSLEQTCPVCSFKAAPDARFCSNCGAALDGSGQPSAGDADLSRYLPETLLAKLRSARSGHAMQGERRTVTMLFADIQGSTAAAEQMDPEDWATVVNGAFEHLIAPVYAYEGTLAQIQGDAVLAFFGAPVAHEDDPTRAIRAGLEIVEGMAAYSEKTKAEWGTPIQARVGINTGLVVVGDVGSDLRVEYTALGDAINVAARMEQTARPGTVQVTSTTLALTGHAFEVEDLGPVEVKGKSEPVVSHRVIRFVGGAGGAEDRVLVGREEEIRQLESLHRRLVDGSGWIGSIVGEAGLGKSRLLHEFRSRISASTTVAEAFDTVGDIGWMFGMSRSYDTAKPLSTMRDLLRRWWRIEDPTQGFARVEMAATGAGFDDPDVAALLGFVAGVSMPEDAEAFLGALPTSALNARVSEAFIHYMASQAGSRPLVMVLEDLHWADDLSLALVESVMDLTDTDPIGLLLAMRPYRDDPSWRIHEVADRAHHHRYHYLELTPLPDDETMALVDSLLVDVPISDENKRRLLMRADGNPLFVEEMIRSIAESGDANLSIPDSLSGILTSRLDRLDEASRFTAQMASVFGVEFSREALGALLDPIAVQTSVADLLRRGIFVETATGDLGFRHALIRETAYETILRRTRRDLHRQVAEYLVASSPKEAGDISMHLVEAGEVERAFPYLLEAAREGIRSMALADAIRLLSLAIDNTPADAPPELVEQAHEALGEAYALVPDLTQASAAYQRLYKYGEELERPSARVAALNHLAYATASIGLDLDAAQGYLDQARVLAEEAGDNLGLAQYHMNACYVASMGGHLAKAAEHDEATVNLGEKAGVGAIRLSGLVRRAVNYSALVDLDRAEGAVESGLEAAEEMGDEESKAVLQALGVATISFIKGDIRSAVEVATKAQAGLERFASFYTSMNLANIGYMFYLLGDLEDALAHLSGSRRVAEHSGQPFVAGAATSNMALVYATAGVTEEVSPLVEESLRSLDGPMGEFMASSIWANLGFVHLLQAELDEAAEAFETGLGVSSISQFQEEPRLLAGQALCLIRSGDPSAAEPILRRAWEVVEERRYVPPRALLHLAQAEAAIAEDRHEDAFGRLAQAHQEAMTTGQRVVSIEVLETRIRLARQTGGDSTQDLRAARVVVDAMAETIANEMLRERFSKSRAWVLET